MKRALGLVVVVFAVLAVVVFAVLALGMAGTVAADGSTPDCTDVEYSGDGSSENPYEITDADELQCLGDGDTDSGLDDHFELQNDIDLSDAGVEDWNDGDGFEPIAASEIGSATEGTSDGFVGSFDGDGHTISGLEIDRDDDENVGLFGLVGDGGDVSDVTLENVDVTGGDNVGGLVGMSTGDVSHSRVTGEVWATDAADPENSYGVEVGGLVGRLDGDSTETGTISHSSAAVNVTAESGERAGGLVGAVARDKDETAVTHSFATGNVTGVIDVGGLAGLNNGEITDSYATGAVTGDGPVGGLVGRNTDTDTSRITSSYSTGVVDGSTNVGGLVGNNEDSEPIDSYWDTEASGTGDSDGGEGLTTSEMTGESAEGEMDGFDFGATWETVEESSAEATADGYPILTALENDPQLHAQGIAVAGGEGTEESPYEIENWYHLDTVRENLGSDFVLVGDLDEETAGYEEIASEMADGGDGFEPIGTEGSPFTGTFDGNSYQIDGLVVDREPTQDAGLFGVATGSDVEIADLRLENVDITGGANVGGLAGTFDGPLIQNVSVDGKVSAIGPGVDGGGIGGDRVAAGLIVGLNGASNDVSYDEVAATGTVRVDTDADEYAVAAGLVGVTGGGVSVSTAYAQPRIEEAGHGGGAIGWTSNVSSTYETLYTTPSFGDVETKGAMVAIIGSDADHEFKESAYYNDTSRPAVGDDFGDSGVERNWQGLPTEDMQGSSAEEAMDNLDFETRWQTVANDFPVFQWQAALADGDDVAAIEALDVDIEPNAAGEITVVATDELGNVIENEEIEVEDDGGLDTLSAGQTETTDEDGEATFSFETGEQAEYTPEFSADSGSITDTSTVTLRYAAGEGTDSDPYEIEDWHHLDNVRENLDADFLLVEDLDEETSGYDNVASETANDEKGFEPIGECSESDLDDEASRCDDSSIQFSGTVDGNGHVISNLTVDRPDTIGVGLFGISDEAVFENLRLMDVDLHGKENVGGLSGALYSSSISSDTGTVENVSVTGEVHASGPKAGGIVGHGNNADLTNQISFVGTTEATHEAGGIVGRSSGSTEVSFAYAQADVVTTGGDGRWTDDAAGGIVGDSGNKGAFEEIYFNGTVASDGGENEGAIIGAVNEDDDHTNVHWNRDYAPEDGVGGGGTADTTNYHSLTTAEMQGSEAEDNMAFDWENIWQTVPGDYPVFQWEAAAADTVEIAGTVTDALDDEPLEGATVESSVDETETDGDGEYELEVSIFGDEVNATASDVDEGFTITNTSEIEDPEPADTLDLALGPDYDGEGTAESPFEVQDLEDLQQMRYNLSAHYELTDDIDASDTESWFGGKGFEPIGACEGAGASGDGSPWDQCDSEPSFKGSFDGQSNTISNLTINRTDTIGVGLFGAANEANVSNLRLTSVDITGDENTAGLVGQLISDDVDSGGGFVENVSVEGTIEGGLNTGGLVGHGMDANLDNENVFAGTVTGSDEVGGILGRASHNTIVSTSYVRATVEAKGKEQGRVYEDDDDAVAGGLVGDSGNPSDFSEVYTVGDVTGDVVGAIVGDGSEDTFENVYWDDDEGPDRAVGGYEDPAGVTGLSTDEMQGSAAEENMAFDWEDTWQVVPGDYPVFQWEAAAAEGDDVETIEASDVTIAPNEEGEITVEASDGFGNEIEDEEISVEDDGGLGGLSTDDAETTNESGVATFTFEESDGGEYTVEFAADEASITDTATVTIIYAGGEGTEESPYEIENWHHLDDVRENLDANFTLANDLNQSTDGYDDVANETVNDGDGFEPIGDSDDEFTGTFDGDGHTIESLSIDRDDEDRVGLFGETDNATIENVRLSNVDITGDNGVGGLIGLSNGSTVVAESSVTGTVSGVMIDVGGLIGSNVDSTIKNSFATSDVDGEGPENVGGLVGFNDGDIEGSYATGDVTGAGDDVGGLVGENEGAIEESYATGAVDGDDVEGGLVGFNDDGDVSDSYWDRATTNQQDAIGQDDGSTAGLEGFGDVSDEDPASEMTGLNATGNMTALEFTDGDGTWHVTDTYPALAWEETNPFYEVTIEETNSPVVSEETLTVTTNVTNWAGDGEQTVTLSDTGFSDDEQDATDVELDTGEGEEIALEWETDTNDVGTGDVTVASENDTDSEDITVESDIDSVAATIDDEADPTVTTGKAVDVTVSVEDENGDPVNDEEVSIDDLETGGDDVTIDGLTESDTATTDSNGNATFEDVTFSGAIDATIDVTVSAEDDTEDVLTVTVGGFAAGDGSASDPYVITDWYHLDNVRLHLDGAFELGGTLDEETDGYDDVASETANDGDGFEPIGKCNEADGCDPDFGASPFSGTFDGNDTEISGLVINSENPENGLFGAAGDGATIENVRLHDIDIDIDTADNFPVTGGIVGFLTDGEITRSSVTGEIVSSQDSDTGVGGLVGENWGGTIEQSYANTTVTGGDDQYVGGLVGFNFDDTLFHGTGSISDSYATGDVSGGADDFGTGVGTGGLVGSNSGDISNSYATGDVDADENVGGLVGSNSGDITSSYWDDQAATVTEDGEAQDGQGVGDGGGNVAGLTTGEMTGDRAEDNMAFDFVETWDVDADEPSDGLTVFYPVLQDNTQDPSPSDSLYDSGDGSEASPYEIEDWEHLETVRIAPAANFTLANDLDAETDGYDDVASESANDGDGFDPIGDSDDEFTGYFDGADRTISDLYINRSDESYVGLFGYVDDDGTVENVGLEDATVEGEQSVGGLVGYNYGEVSGSSANGSVNGSVDNVGGLVGVNHGGTVSKSSATGNVTLDGPGGNVGGLVGLNTGDVTASYATGSAESADGIVGGLVGQQTGGEATISQSYAVGNVTGDTDTDVGGLVGASEDDATVENAYWDVETTGQDDSDGGTGLTTAELTGDDALDSLDGFESDSWTENAVFEVGDTLVYPYPTLTDNEPAFAPNRTLESLAAADVTVDGGEPGTVDVTVTDDVGPWGSLPLEIADDDGLTLSETENATDADGVASFEFEEGTVGEYVVSIVPEAGDAVEDTATVTVETGTAESVEIETEPAGTQTAGASLTGHPAVTVTNEFGNPVDDVEVSVEAIDGAGELTEESTTTVETDSEGVATFDDLVIETADEYRLEFAIDDDDENVDSSDTAETDQFDVDPADPADVSVTPEDATAAVSDDFEDEYELEYTVTVEDDFENPVPEVDVELTDDGDEISVDGERTQDTGADGDVTFTVQSTVPQEDVTFTFTEQSEENEETAKGTFETGTPDSIDATVTDDEAIADGTDEVEFTVTIEDEFDNPVEDATVEVDDAEDVDELDGLDAEDTAQTDASGEATFTATSTNDGAFAVQFSERDAGAESATATFVVGEPASVSAETTVDTATADGSDELEFEVIVTDANDNAVEGVEVGADHDGTDVDVEPEAPETDGDGMVTFTATSTDAQEDVEFTFEEAENENSDTSDGTFESGDPDLLVVEDTTETAGEEGKVAITLEDEFENPIPGETVGIDDTGGIDDLDGETVETNDTGEATISFTEETADSYDVTLEVVDDTDVTGEATVTVGPAAPDSLIVEDTTETAGEEGTLTLTLEDEFDNPVPDETLEVTDADGIGELEDATTETDGDGEATLSFTEAGADEHTVEIGVEGDTSVSDSATVTVEPADANSVEIETSPDETQTAGVTLTGSPAVLVTDEFDNPVAGVDVAVEVTEGDGDFTQESTTAVDTNENGEATFDDLLLETADEYRLEFSIDDDDGNVDSSDTAETDQFDVDPADPADVSVTPEDAMAAVSDDFEDENELEYTVTVEDEFDNPVPEVDVELTDDGDDIDVDGDGTQQTDADGSVSFSVQSTVPQEDVAFTFTEQEENNDAVATGTFETGEATALEVTDAPDSMTAGDEFELTVNATDEFDNPAADQTLENVEVSSEHDGEVTTEGSLDLDEYGGMVVTVEASEVTTADDEHELTVDADGVDSDDTTVAVDSANATAVSVLEHPDTTQVAGETLTSDSVVNTTDEFGNPVEDVAVSVEAIDGEGSITAGETTATTDEYGNVTFDDLAIETADEYRLEFSIGDDDENVDSSDTTETDQFDVEPADPADVSVTPETETTTVSDTFGDGNELEYTVTVEDEFENPVPDVTVGLTENGTDIDVDGDRTRQTNSSGEVSFTVQSETVQKVEFTFTEQDNDNADTATGTFEADDPAVIDAEVTEDEATADGSEEIEFTVTVEDQFGNAVEDATVEVTDDGGATFATTSNETDADGETIFTATSIDSGEFTVEFSETDAGEDSATATFVAGVPATVTAEAIEDTTTADGTDQLEFKVTVTDANNNPVEGVEVTATHDSTDVDIDPTSPETNEDGEVTFTATSETAQEVEFTFTEQENDNSDTTTGTFEAGDPAEITAEVTDDEAIADGDEDVEFTVTLEDQLGNAVEYATVEVTADAGLTFADSQAATDAGGEATFTATSTDAGEFTVEFEEQQNENTDTATATFVAGPPDSLSVDVVVDEVTADGNEAVEFEVTVEDANDNPVEGVTVETTDDGTDIDYAGEDDQETDEDGQVTVTATSTTAQDDVMFTFEEQEEQTDATAEATFEAGDVTSVELEPDSDQTIEAGEAIEFNATAYDAYDNPVEDDDTEFTWQNTTVDGTFDTTTAGEYEVTAELDSVSTESVTVTVEEADTDRVEIDPATDQTIEAGEAIDFTATAYDEFDNVVEDDETNFDWQNANEGLFSETTAGTYDVTATYGGVTAETVTVTVLQPSNFTIDSVQTNAPIDQGESLEITAEVENVGEAHDVQRIELQIDGERKDSKFISLAGDTSETVELHWDTDPNEAGEYQAEVKTDDDSHTVDVTIDPVGDAFFEVDILETNSPIDEGETLNVEAEITNTGDVADEQSITLEIDGDEVDTQTVDLDAHASETITLEWHTGANDAGQYTAEVTTDNDTQTDIDVRVEEEAFFDVTIEATNAPITEGEELDVDVLVENTGGQEDAQTIALFDFDENEIDTETISLDGGEDETITLVWTTDESDAGTGEITIESDDDTDEQTITIEEPLDPPHFDVTIADTNTPIVAGEPLEVETEITNTGDVADEQSISLEIDGDEIDAEEIDLDANTSETIILEWNTEPDDTGQYTAEVTSDNDTDEQTITIEEPLDPPHFDVTIADTNTPIVEGEPLELVATIENTGERVDERTVTFTVANVTDDRDVELEPGENETITFEWATNESDAGEYTAEIATGDETVETNVTVEAATTEFAVAAVETNEPVTEGQNLTIEATIENVGDVNDTRSVSLVISATNVTDVEYLTLEPGETDTVVFEWSTEAADAGEYTVEVRTATDTAETDVTVHAAAADLTLALAEATIFEGAETTATATVTFTDNETAAVTDEATVESDDEAIATVADDGTVTGVAPGTTTLSASYDGLEANASVTIENAEPDLVSAVVTDDRPDLLEMDFSSPVSLAAPDRTDGFSIETDTGTEPASIRSIVINDAELLVRLDRPLVADENATVRYDNESENLVGPTGIEADGFEQSIDNQVDPVTIRASVAASSYRVLPGAEVDLRAGDSEVEDAENATYEWSINGDIVATDNETIAHTFDSPGEHEIELVVGVIGTGATDSDTLTIDVEDRPPVAVLDANETVEIGADPGFDAGTSSDDVGITNYEWDFGDGHTAAGANLTAPTHNYSDPGVYEVTLTVTDTTGDTDTATTTVLVEGPDASVDPATLEFGTISNTSSSTRSVTIANDGTAPLTVTDAIFEGDDAAAYAIDEPLGGGENLTVRADDARSLGVTFAPTAADMADNATLTLETDAPEPSSFQIDLSGEGAVSDLEPVEAAIDAGTVSVGENETIAVGIENTGAVNATLENVTIEGDDAFSVGSTVPTNITANDTVTVPVTFTPEQPGEARATLVAETDEGDVTTVSLAGVGLAPEIRVEDALAIDDTGIQTTTTDTIVVRNAGTDTLTLSNVSIEGADEAHFAIDSAPESIDPDETGAIEVAFGPETTGDHNATMTIESDDPAEPTRTVNLTATAVGASIEIDRRTLDFGTTLVGETVTLNLTVRNVNDSPTDLQVERSSLVGQHPEEFEIVRGEAPFSLEPGESERLTVAFTPNETGERNAQLQLESNAANEPFVTIWLTTVKSYILVQEVSNPTVAVEGVNLDRGSTHRVNTTTPASAAEPVTVTAMSFGLADDGDFSFEAAYSRSNDTIDLGENRHVLQHVGFDPTDPYGVEDGLFAERQLELTVDRDELAPGITHEELTVSAYDAATGEWTDRDVDVLEESSSRYRLESSVPELSAIGMAAPSAGLESIDIDAPDELDENETATATVTAALTDDSTTDVTDEATLESTNETVLAVTDNGTLTAGTEGTATLTAAYAIGDRTQTESLEIAVVDPDAGIVKITNVTADPEELEAGETVGVNTTIENVGNSTVDQPVTLRTDAQDQDHDQVDETAVALTAGEQAVVSLEWTPSTDDIGDHELVVSSEDDEKTVTVTVTEGDTDTAPPPTQPTPDPESQTDPAPRVIPQPDTETAASVTVENVEPGETIVIDGEAAETGDTLDAVGPILVDELSIDVDTDREFDLEVTTFEGDLTPSDGVGELDDAVEAELRTAARSFETDTGMVAVGYVSVETTLERAGTESARFTYRIRNEYLEELGADPANVVLYHDTDDGWIERPTEHVDDNGTHHRFESTTPHFSVFAIGTDAPQFEVLEATIEPMTIELGDAAAIETAVVNRGGSTDETTLTLTSDGDEVATETVTIEPGTTETIILETTPDAAGEYEYAVDGTIAGTLVVEAEPEPDDVDDEPEPDDVDDDPDVDDEPAVEDEPEPAPESDDGLSFGTIILGVGGAILLLGLFALYRRRDEKDEGAEGD